MLIDVNMLSMVEKGTRGGLCHSIKRYAKVDNNCMKDYDKLSQKLPANKFRLVEYLSEFNEDFIKGYNDKK